MKSVGTRAAALTATILLLAGCSSQDNTDSDTSKAGASESSTASESASASASATTDTSASDATPAIVSATKAFLATLSAKEKSSVSFDFSDTEQRQRCSNLPGGLFERDGVMWGDLSEKSQKAWLEVMKATLSTEGYERVRAEWRADDELSDGGQSDEYGQDYYWIAIMGTPSVTDPWQWQWGGHHVTVNATVSGTEVALTPSFVGVQPGTFDDSGTEVRPLGDIEDEAFALVKSLDSAQQGKAILGDQLIDLVLGPGEDGRTIESEGLAGADMTAAQRAALLKLMAHYGELVDDEDAASRMKDLKADLDDTYFAWYGPTDEASGVYFRITGPKIVVEYSGQSMGGDASDHIHGIYRDPTNEYGAALGAGL